jgi:hypothetical protein
LETAQGPLGGAAWAQKEKKATLETAPNNAIVIARVDAAGMCVSLPFFGLRYDAAETAVKGAKLGFATSREEDTSHVEVPASP